MRQTFRLNCSTIKHRNHGTPLLSCFPIFFLAIPTCSKAGSKERVTIEVDGLVRQRRVAHERQGVMYDRKALFP